VTLSLPNEICEAMVISVCKTLAASKIVEKALDAFIEDQVDGGNLTDAVLSSKKK
jgi:hypothetical protein